MIRSRRNLSSALLVPAFGHPVVYEAFARKLMQLDATRGLFRAAFAISLHKWPRRTFLPERVL